MKKNILLFTSTPLLYGGIATWVSKMSIVEFPNGRTIGIVNEILLRDRTVFGSSKKSVLLRFRRIFNTWSSLFKKINNKEILSVHASIQALNLSLFRESISGIHKAKNLTIPIGEYAQ